MGQTVEVQLPARDRWSYNASASALAGLSLAQPGGIEDGQLDLCVWNFIAQSAGTATLAFTGSLLCDPGVPCPAYAIAQTFTVNIRWRTIATSFRGWRPALAAIMRDIAIARAHGWRAVAKPRLRATRTEVTENDG